MSICHSPPLSDQNTYKHVVWTFLRQDQICTFFSWARRRPKFSTTADLIGPPPLKHSKNFKKVMDEFKLPFSITPSTNSFICALRFFHTFAFAHRMANAYTYVRMHYVPYLSTSVSKWKSAHQPCAILKSNYLSTFYKSLIVKRWHNFSLDNFENISMHILKIRWNNATLKKVTIYFKSCSFLYVSTYCSH